MEENLVIVESPAKAKTIKKFLGKNFLVKSSYGHIRDLEKKNYGIDVEKNYQPKYTIPEDKKEIVKELKRLAKETKTVWLATDEDREGEAIAWHLYEVLDLSPEKTKRIVFHEITKEAIQNAIKNSRDIDINLVNAQQARRILDRLVGFELSPVLWRKVRPSLSAGRVQSAALRLIVEREREIINFKSESSYKITGYFQADNKEFSAELSKRLKTKKEVKSFLGGCKSASFQVTDITKKPSKKNPAPPFTTSTLQQEASRKLGFSVKRTMSVAQRLYEAGKITYMRTDSVNLSNAAIAGTKEIINTQFGEKYLKTRKYQTKSKGAQEAHEAIRPTYLQNATVTGSEPEKKLYNLIWKRTVASQMSPAELEKTNIKIDISNQDYLFIATGEILKFDGFLKVYMESSDEEKETEKKGLLPALSVNQKLNYKTIKATEKFSLHPPRYTEASLVKKLEELGIGRPSTYAPTISTIQDRGYVVKEDRFGTPREYNELVLDQSKISETKKTEMAGSEKGKLFPNDVGMVVNDFLKKYFMEIINYNFTANVEEQFDNIAEGKVKWNKMIDKFYVPFHKKVEETLDKAEKNVGERILGTDPKTGRQVSAKIGPYGPMVQLGTKEEEEKPKFAGLQKGQHLETITLEEALKLFELPRKLGEFEGKEVIVGIGRFGPYVKHDSKYASLKKGIDDPFKITLDRAIELIKEKRERDKNKIIKTFKDKNLQILKGRYGPYINYKNNNYRIPKKNDPEKLTEKECMEIITKKEEKNKNSSTKKTKKKTSGKSTKKTTKSTKTKSSNKNKKK